MQVLEWLKHLVTKNTVEGIILMDINAHYVATVIKIVYYHWGDRHISMEENSHKYTQLIQNGTEAIQWRKHRPFNKC